MKFTIDRTIHHTSSDRIKIVEKKERYFSTSENLWDVKYMCQALVQVTGDFDMNDEFIIASDTCSVQFRPKSLFINSKGVFYKGQDKKRIFLTKVEINEMESFMLSAKEYILNTDLYGR